MSFNSEVNVIVGDNGSGKTNLLDAIYMMSFCKSNFQHQDSFLVNYDEDFFRIAGDFEGTDNKLQMSIAFNAQKKKVIQVGDKKLDKLSDHIGQIPLVFIGPRDIQLIFEGSTERRKFLDSGISQLNKVYLQQLVLYKKLLLRRNSYLKSCQPHTFDRAVIESYNQQMLAPAQLLHNERIGFIDKLKPTFESTYKTLSGDNETSSCLYRSQLEKEPFQQLLESSLEKDLVLQRTTTGIHKDDLIFKLNDKSLKKYGSEGQLKTYLLALKLSMWTELNKTASETPLLLLDDIFAKLDSHRVKNLLYFVREECNAQVFISDTHMSRVSQVLSELNMNHSVFTVENNEVNGQE